MSIQKSPTTDIRCPTDEPALPEIINRRGLLARLIGIVLLGVLVGVWIGGWVISMQTHPGHHPSQTFVSIDVFGYPFHQKLMDEIDANRWLDWTPARRAAAGALFGMALALAFAGRATRAVGYRWFTIVYTIRGGAIGALAGVLVCGIGFATLGAIVCAMLEEPGWTAATVLSTGMRLGGPIGIMVGGIAGCILGTLTAATRAGTKFFGGHITKF